MTDISKGIVLQYVLLMLALLITACSSQIPETIRKQPPSNITPAEARNKAQQFHGQQVRWGGEIISVVNKPEHTDIIVLAKPLDKDGKPSEEAQDLGRFIARLQRFIEPSRYAEGRSVTMTGRFDSIQQQKIGEYLYPYPVLITDSIYLWPLPVTTNDDPWFDPWYDPWYPWGPWHHPWHRH